MISNILVQLQRIALYIYDEQWLVLSYQWGITIFVIVFMKMSKITNWTALLILELINLRNLLPMYDTYTQKFVKASLYEKYDLFLSQYTISYYLFLVVSFIDVPEKVKVLITIARFVMWSAMLIIFPATDQETVSDLLKVGITKIPR